ncbi:MAG: transaldolase [Ignavibacterium sp.]|nr:transaldolase [Ignavibacterium sp.]MDW8374698.1 transaldolase [Ignavibacteriales bacterium]
MNFNVKIFADGADKLGILEMNKNVFISGFTTNPSLMRKAGVKDYEAFAKEILSIIKDKPISFEVISDDFDEMYVQAKKISGWGNNVYVKIPIMNTKAVSSFNLIKRLTNEGIKVNVTAIMTKEQVIEILPALQNTAGAYVSVFAGRIADSGRDPIPIMTDVIEIIRSNQNVELIWASPRELFNLIQADRIGCHIITMTNDLLKKIPLIGKDLNEFSLETVKMFYEDALSSNFQI